MGDKGGKKDKNKADKQKTRSGRKEKGTAKVQAAHQETRVAGGMDSPLFYKVASCQK